MEDRYTETQHTWNKIAQLYEDTFMQLDLYNATYASFCNYLNDPKGSVLELGCGPGNITRHLLELQPDLSILATDTSQNMIGLAKKNNPSVETLILDCRDVNSLQQTFDGIICGFTIPYLSNEAVSDLIRDCASLLNRKGVFYLSYVEGTYEDSGFISGSSGDRTYFYYHQFENLKRLLEANRFKIMEDTDVRYEKQDGSAELHKVIIAVRGE